MATSVVFLSNAPHSRVRFSCGRPDHRAGVPRSAGAPGRLRDFNINAVIAAAAGAAIVGRMIGYVIGHTFGSWLLLRYGHYVGLTTGRIKLGQYLFLRY